MNSEAGKLARIFAKRVREVRLANDMTIKECEAMLGNSAWSDYEHAFSLNTLNTVERIADILGVSVVELLTEASVGKADDKRTPSRLNVSPSDYPLVLDDGTELRNKRNDDLGDPVLVAEAMKQRGILQAHIDAGNKVYAIQTDDELIMPRAIVSNVFGYPRLFVVDRDNNHHVVWRLALDVAADA